MPIIALRLKARVGLPLEVRPRVLDIGTLAGGTSREIFVTLINYGKVPVRPVYGTSTSPNCTALISRAVIAPSGGKLRVPIVIRGGSGSGQIGKATVHIHTDCNVQPQVAVRIKYTIAAESGGSATVSDAAGKGKT